MTGIEVHLGNAGITLRDPAHLARVQQLFALAQRRRAPVLIHVRPRRRPPRRLRPRLLPAARRGAGRIRRRRGGNDPRMSHLYVDVSSNVTDDIAPADAALVAQRIRQVGLGRVLYGSDLSVPGGSIARGWEIFRTKLPLTTAELQQIATNRTRFARQFSDFAEKKGATTGFFSEFAEMATLH
jgi:hypothetical protein